MPVTVLAGTEEAGKYRECVEKLPTVLGELQALHNTIKGHESKRVEELKAEEERRRKMTQENRRRRHDYVPFVLGMLKALEKKKLLGEMITKIKQDEETKLKEAAKRPDPAAIPAAKREEKK